MQRTTAHVFRIERKRGPVWYAKCRLSSGRQVQKLIGPAWSARGRPPAGYYTKRTAEDWLLEVLDQARRGTLPGMVRTGVTLSDAAAEWLRYCEHERAVKRSTLSEVAARGRRAPAWTPAKPARDGAYETRPHAVFTCKPSAPASERW